MKQSGKCVLILGGEVPFGRRGSGSPHFLGARRQKEAFNWLVAALIKRRGGESKKEKKLLALWMQSRWKINF